MSMIENAELAPNTVIAVMQKVTSSTAASFVRPW